MKSLRLAACITLLFPLLAHAQIPVSDVDLKRFYARVGASFIYPDDNNTSLKYHIFQDWNLYRTEWDIDDDVGWNISGVWRPLPYFGVELMYADGADFSLSLDHLKGRPGHERIDFGRFSASSANLFVNWYMMDLDCLGQPYLGIGVNYSDFYDDDLYPEFQNFLINSGIATGPSDFGMRHSWGASAQLGIDWRLGRGVARSWLINAAVIYTDANTDTIVTYTTDPGYQRLYSDFEVNPWTLNLGITYEF
ncbi:OmpW/AlkL family protein [Microbulbifer elongatus]|uniref:OmpW/AlkL family protein n=1 Tax=Microbulbifer elongatus TaxID=86173 RepID=UPI001E4B3744|nr:OmpW family outer membrane protein [Microbulbifer elongatus]